MKILLFTHEQDIDGMGSIIIGKYSFDDFDYITCKTHEVNQNVGKTIDDGSIYNYDFIYVTDISIKEPLLTNINNDYKLKNKILVLDHHESVVDEGGNKYPFVNITITDEHGKTSGTSLFYDYLKNGDLLKTNDSLDELVELTRQYDTWEWKEIYNNKKARMLHILFEQLGYQKYIDEMFAIVNERKTFEFNEYQLKLINNFEKELKKELINILKDMKIYKLKINDLDYKIGFVETLYQYRNDLKEVILKYNNNDIDLLGMIIKDKDSVSFRSVKNVDASKVASYFGGGGHRESASSPKDNPRLREIFELLK